MTHEELGEKIDKLGERVSKLELHFGLAAVVGMALGHILKEIL